MNETSPADQARNAAIVTAVAGALGFVWLMIRRGVPILGERIHRAFGEKAFAPELARSKATAEAVARIEPLIMRIDARTSETHHRVERLEDVLLRNAVPATLPAAREGAPT